MAKTLPPKAYYRLEEVAKDWNCDIESLFDYAEQGLLTISVKAYQYSHVEGIRVEELDDGTAYCSVMRYYEQNDEPFPHGLFPVDASTIRNFRTSLEHPDAWTCHDFSAPSKLEDIDCWRGEFQGNEIFITREEKTRFGTEGWSGVIQVPDEELATMPEELSWAIKAWRALYRDKGISSKKGHKGQIRAWLKENASSIKTKEARERIATVVNQRKNGGTPPLD